MGDEDKIIRTTENLIVKLSKEEVDYRNKYLPDPSKLTNEKLVCTVCSVSLAVDVHKGHDIFIHKFLQVLVCEACYNFYGDGCFSTDEDGDDKYCRWCGQGGTLFLCCACTCAFCKKCVKQNLKESVIAELDNDDWKCYVCNPRPLFGTRTICWGAQELKKVGKVKEMEKLKKQKEKLEKLEEKKRQENERRSKKTSDSEVETSKKKRRKRSDSDSSPEVMPSKKSRRDSKGVNGNMSKRVKKKRDSSSEDQTSEDEKKPSRRSRSSTKKNQKYVDSSSDEDSDFKSKNKSKSKKKKTRERSDESSDKDRTKLKQKNIKKNTDSSDGSSDEKNTKKKRLSKKKSKDSSDSSSDEKLKKKRNVVEKTKASCSNKDSTISAEDLVVKKRIKLAILWLTNTVKDISDLALLISRKATSFGRKKINCEHLKTYEDVLNTVSKLKNLLSGVHSNYEHIGKNLDSQLKPWKILTGLEEAENEIQNEKGNLSTKKDVGKHNDSSVDSTCIESSENAVKTNVPEKNKKEVEDNIDDMNLQLSGDESDDEKKATEALIFKASETLDKMEAEENGLVDKINKSNGSNSNVQSKSFSTSGQDNKTSSPSKTNLVLKDTSLSETELSDKLKRNTSPKMGSQERLTESENDDSKESEVSGKPQKSSETVIKGTDSELDENLSPKKSKKEDSSLRQSNKRGKNVKESRRKPLKKNKESSVQEVQADLKKKEPKVSSSDDSSFESFSKKISSKWEGGGLEEVEAVLPSSFGLDSSEESDLNLKPSASNKPKVSSARKRKIKITKERIITKEKETEEDIACEEEKGEKTNKKATTKSDKGPKAENGEDKSSKNKPERKGKSNKKNITKKVIKEEETEADANCENVPENNGSDIEMCEIRENEDEEEAFNNDQKDNTVQDLETPSKDKSKQLLDLELPNDEADKKDIKTEDMENSDPSDKKKTLEKSKEKEKTLKKKSVHNQRRSKFVNLLDSSDEENELENKDTKEIVSIDSSDQENKKNEKGKKNKDNSSDSLIDLGSAESSDSDIFRPKKQKPSKETPKSSNSDSEDEDEDEDSKSKTKKKRKLKRCANSTDESGSGDGGKSKNQKSSQGESPGKGGRKNIKKIKKQDDLADATKEAAEEEKERRKRIEERQKLYNKVFEIQAETKTVDSLVLDFDPEEKKELISVDKDLVAKMKPHQAKGVKFMWDSCFESISLLKKESGSGCILAHCMGLGKTFQVISLVHTVLMHPETLVRTVMVVCPLSTVLNWFNEFGKWLDGIEGGDNLDVYHLANNKQNPERARELRHWQDTGGVLIIGYDMFRNLTCPSKKFKPKMRKDFQETLVDPGADLIVCDEGHMLKNEATALSKAMNRVKSLRRIVLTGTPMQNNLKEYHCMVQFVKPSLLGTRKEFLNRFVNPITNGQFVDSTDRDVKIMKRRSHVLHKMLEGLVQRFDYNVLTPYLPPKHEYVVSVCLSELQVKLYQLYLNSYSQMSDNTKAGSRLFQDWQALGRVWTHPLVLKMSLERDNIKKMMEEDTDEEGSLEDFIDDDDAETTAESSDGSSSDKSKHSNEEKKKKVAPKRRATRSTRSSKKINDKLLESSEDESKAGKEEEVEEVNENRGSWWGELVDSKHMDDINQSGKLVLLFAILKECEEIEDKVLVFSQSLFSLDLIEYFLDKIDAATQENLLEESLGNHQGNWSKGLDYFRLDGSTSSENRNIWCKAFNRGDNPRARLFLISTRAGGLGINLTGANRVIIFDASWNPSHDVQSIFRVYRFGQKKPCYIYRFIAYGTMEEKVYDRQVAKQSISNRVVDEQQVHRHFSSRDLNELYSFTPPSKIEDRPTPALPSDVLMAEILKQFGNWIEKYHEHDSLLENVEEETLTEEERKLAWEDYENDKKGPVPANIGSGLGQNYLQAQIEIIKRNLLAQYPEKTEKELQPIIVYQVTQIMRQNQLRQQQLQQQQQQQHQLMMQQMANQQLAAMSNSAMAGVSSFNPQMFANTNLTQEQQFNLQVLQMKKNQQQTMFNNIYQNNLKRLQMTQVRQKVPQGVMSNQPQTMNQLSQLLSAPQPSSSVPKEMLMNPNLKFNLEKEKQNVEATKPTPQRSRVSDRSKKSSPSGE